MALTAITIIGLLAAVCSSSSFITQVVKTVSTRTTKDRSLMMYVILSTGVALWLVYGIFIVDWPLILANTVTLALAMPILFFKIREEKGGDLKDSAT